MAQGEFLALIGPSGCGKTTTLNMLNRLEQPDAGTIRIDGADIQALDPVKLRRRIGYAFQDAGLFPHMTWRETSASRPGCWAGNRRRSRPGWRNCWLWCAWMPAGFGARMPAQLSGGQRQRVALARALAAQPKIMLLDEPFGALDPLTREELAADYRRIHQSLGLTTVLVTHDMTEALLLADRIAVMRAGRLVQVGHAARTAGPARRRFRRRHDRDTAPPRPARWPGAAGVA